jgi:hypothetical protein
MRVKTIMFRHLFVYLTVVVVIGANAKIVGSNYPGPAVKTVGFCDLISNSEDYNGKTVRTKATYCVTFEGTTISGRDCHSNKAVASARLECKAAIQCLEMENKLRSLLKGNPIDGETVEVVVVGRVQVKPRTRNDSFNEPKVAFYIQSVESVTPSKEKIDDSPQSTRP